MLDELLQFVQEFLGRCGAQLRRCHKAIGAVEQGDQMLFVISYEYAWIAAELLQGCDLMPVAMLAASVIASKDDDRLAQFKGGDDRPHSCMAYHKTCLCLQRGKRALIQKGKAVERLRLIIGRPDLREDVASPALHGPLVHCLYKSIKRQLRTNGQ